MLPSCILNPNPSYSRFVFVLSVIQKINFVFGSYEFISGYLFSVTEVEQEEEKSTMTLC